MVASCTEVNAWEEGCSSVVDPEQPCDPFKGEQRFVALNDQTLFTLTAFQYSPGTNSFSVHRNGLLVDPAKVQELSAVTFWIQEDVQAGDIVVASALTGVTSETKVLTTDLSSSKVILVDSQTVIPFSVEIPITNSALYINGFGIDNGRLVEDTDYTKNILNNTITLIDSYPAGTVLLLVYNDAGANTARLVTALYDFAVDGGLVSTIALSETFPDNSTIIRAWYEVLTVPTSAGVATIAFGIETDDVAGLLAATAFDDAAFALGYHDFLPDSTAANFTTKSAAVRDLIMVIAGAALTAGKIRIWYEYLTSE